MALNYKLRKSASLNRVATDVWQHGGFSLVGNRYYYAYVNRSGNGIVKVSTDGGNSWSTNMEVGPTRNLSARGPWLGWSEGNRAVVYDLQQQWRILDAAPHSTEGDNALTGYRHVIPLPEINAVQYSPTGVSGATVAGEVKSVNGFGQWDESPFDTVRSGTGGFTTTNRDFRGVYGDQRPQGQGNPAVTAVYLEESWYLGSPFESKVVARNFGAGGLSGTGEVQNDYGENMIAGLGVKGFEGSPDLTSGTIGSSRRGPPGLGTHNRGVPASMYSPRMHGEQIGLRHVSDMQGSGHSFNHGGAWVDEFGVVAAAGQITGVRGVIFCDSAGAVVMVKNSGSQFGEWSEAKVYGNPGVAPEALWIPYSRSDVRCGIYGGGQAWFLVDPNPDFIPRGRLVGGEYLAPDPSRGSLEQSFRKVVFW